MALQSGRVERVRKFLKLGGLLYASIGGSLKMDRLFGSRSKMLLYLLCRVLFRLWRLGWYVIGKVILLQVLEVLYAKVS